MNPLRCLMPRPPREHQPVSSDGETWVWAPRHNVPLCHHGQGATWTACAGAPMDTRVIADRVTPSASMASRFRGQAVRERSMARLTSRNGPWCASRMSLTQASKRGGNGADNRSDRGDDRGGQDRIYATPGREGDLWLAASTASTTRAPRALIACRPWKRSTPFGLARQLPRPRLRLYLVGTVHGQRGSFRSTDSGATGCASTTISTSGAWSCTSREIPKSSAASTWATHGRGTFYGDPVRQVVAVCAIADAENKTSEPGTAKLARINRQMLGLVEIQYWRG